MSRICLGFVLCMYIPLLSNAQQFGGNATTTQWKQINTDTARIIFPNGLDSVGYKVASIIRQVAISNPLSLGNQLQKINIILQNQPVITNGYVMMGPYKSEFYTNPSSDNYDASSLSWPTQLTVHEYRHVQQYNNFNKGASRLMKKLFGDEGYALAVNAAVPNWFFEGDAVYFESLLAPHGRGTLPFFLKAYPALWQSHKDYSWMKLRNGSLKDYVPNHYDMGYLLVNYGTKKYGYNFWKKVTSDASAYKGLWYPFQNAIKKYAGVSFKTFRDSAFQDFKQWYSHSNPYDATQHLKKTIKKQTVTHYFFPYQISATELLYLKSSYEKRPAFYIQTPHQERMIRHKDISIDDQFGYRNGKIVYAAYENHPRWRWTGYSVIKLLDIHSGKQQTVTSKTRLFTPDISPDGSKIVANQVALNGKSSLVILNAQTGKPLQEIYHEQVNYFSSPKLINNDTVIAVLRNKNATTNIALIDLKTGATSAITPPSQTLIGYIDAHQDKVFFSASQKLKDELYYVDLNNKQLYQLHTPGVGSYYLSGAYDQLNWSQFTAEGFQLKHQKFNADDWIPMNIDSFTQTETGMVYDTLDRKIDVSKSQSFDIQTTSYSKLSNPINFHSWRPNYSDPEYSITLYGNNILNTTETQLYYLYNENDKTHTAGGSFVYGGLYPFITIGSEYTLNRKSIISQKLKEWNEWNNFVGLNIPLSWSSNQTYKSFNVSSSYHFRADYNKGINVSHFKDIKFSYLSHGISWTEQVPSALQDIYPRWGYHINSQFRHAISNYKSWQSNTTLNLYLPGIVPTHSIVLSTSLQYAGAPQRIFGNRIAFARGQAAQDSAGVYAVRANYHFPIFYPDWGMANIIYLQRVRANAFQDYVLAFNKNATQQRTQQSIGIELFFDTKWWNQHPITFGFRVGKHLLPKPQNGNLFFEFILPTNLIPR